MPHYVPTTLTTAFGIINFNILELLISMDGQPLAGKTNDADFLSEVSGEAHTATNISRLF